MRKSFLYLILFFAFYACAPKDNYFNIPEEHLPVYAKGDLLVYKSGNNYDTFTYLQKHMFYSDIGKLDHDQYITFAVRNKKDTALSGFVDIQLFATMINWMNFFALITQNVKTDSSLVMVNGHAFKDVYIFNCGQPDTNRLYATKIYFTYKNWVIRYVRSDSTTWDLISH